MAPTFRLLSETVYGHQETWHDSPAGWRHPWKVSADAWRSNGRPTAQ
jgi:hypothetical protein